MNNIINTKEYNDRKIEFLSEEFGREGYVKLPNFFSDVYFKALNDEIARLSKHKLRRDFIMQEYDSPRNLSVLGGSLIKKESAALLALYNMDLIRFYLSSLTKTEIHPVKHTEEYMVVNILDGARDTHGWHLDDPDYALIICLEAPSEGCGGDIEYVKDWQNFCLENREKTSLSELIRLASEDGRIIRDHLNTYECYLLHASKSMHRVTPLTCDNQRRVAINLAFHSRPNIDFGTTADQLYEAGQNA